MFDKFETDFAEYIDSIKVASKFNMSLLDVWYYASGELSAMEKRPTLEILTNQADISSFCSIECP